jgi:hypothetical protein
MRLASFDQLPALIVLFDPMSMTLLLWKAPVVDDPDEAQRLLQPWYDHEDDSAFEPSDDLGIVLARLLERWPFDPETGSDPWADGPENTGRLLDLSISWSGDDRILAHITALARIYGLVLYDPQGPDVFLPTDPIEELTEFPGFKLVDWLKIGAMVAALTGLTYAAWLIPHWLKWLVVVVAGFFALAAWFVLVAMMFGRQIMKPEDAGP